MEGLLVPYVPLAKRRGSGPWRPIPRAELETDVCVVAAASTTDVPVRSLLAHRDAYCLRRPPPVGSPGCVGSGAGVDLGWPHRRCIFCLREPSEAVPFSRAHLVPDSIGGFVWAWTKCKECNEQTGATIEAGIVNDDSIQLAVAALAAQLPELAEKFSSQTGYVAKTPQGLIRARRRGDEYELLTTKSDDGSLIASREDARAAVEKRLQREGRKAAEIAAGLARFDEAADGIPVRIGDSTITHGALQAFDAALTGKPVSEAFPSLIAFHFLALSLGPSIYDEQLNPLRRAIREGSGRSDWHVAERWLERRYVPEHLVGFAQTEPYLVVRVQLFGWNVWRVHFPRISSPSEPHGYLLDLVSRQIVAARPRRTQAIQLPEQ
jgi:hypothetical protein